ncbi:MAG: JAB domain-containing protein [Bacteroidales bacterium]|jgi:DNA repair protein RadC
MIKYKTQPEIVIAGFNDGIQVPEIKVRFNKGKKIFASVKSSKDVYDFLLKLYGRDIETQEKCVILYLKKTNDIIGYYKHSVGGVDATIMDIKLIVSTAIKALASSIIISHNHPSGNTKPSEPDKATTNRIIVSAKDNNIQVLDHIIVTKNNGYFSFADEGVLYGLNESKKTTTMKITKDNYFEIISKYDISELPKALQETHELFKEATGNGNDFAMYDELDNESKEVFELYFEKLSQWFEKNGKKETQKNLEPIKKGKHITILPAIFSINDYVLFTNEKQKGKYIVDVTFSRYFGQKGKIIEVIPKEFKSRKFPGDPTETKRYSVYKIELKDGIIVNNVGDHVLVETTPFEQKEEEKKEVKSEKEKKLTLSDIPSIVKTFMPEMQQKAIVGSEEHWEVIKRLKDIIEKMPVTYETENIKNPDKIAYLHYFYGDSDWYIIEKDVEKEQLQAFGYVILNGDTQNAEFGYISIEELKSINKIELDFYFSPKTMREIFKKKNIAQDFDDDRNDEHEAIKHDFDNFEKRIDVISVP